MGENTYNVYYIALFWDTATNGSLNFKIKDCEIEDCVAFTTACPEDVLEDSCQTQTQINSSFETWLNGFTASGEPSQNPVVEWFVDGQTVGNTKPTVSIAPDGWYWRKSIPRPGQLILFTDHGKNGESLVSKRTFLNHKIDMKTEVYDPDIKSYRNQFSPSSF